MTFQGALRGQLRARAALPPEFAEWAEVHLRVKKVGIEFPRGGDVEEYTWNRRKKSWCNSSGPDNTFRGLFGLMFRSSYVDVIPGGGFQVRIRWNDKTEMFTGLDEVNERRLRVSQSEVERLVSDPDQSVEIGIK